MSKKLISIVLALVMVLSIMTVGVISINAAEMSGTCGDNATWVLDSEGTLTISGTGAIRNYSSNRSPFYNRTDIKKVIIESGISRLGNYAFIGSSLTSITIPDSVTSIGEHAFSVCKSLASITIPDGVTSINDYTFYGCKSLTSVNIPNSVTSIGNDAFSLCDSLTSIDIPDSVTSIGEYAFYYCKSLTSIDIPDSVTSIGDDAFWVCDSLILVTISDSVTSIGKQTFRDCKSLTSIDIPDSVTSIGEYAFSDCTALTSITIPDSVTSIGNDAFYGCYSLTSIDIPDSVTSIGVEAFCNCDSLTSINIPDSVTSISTAYKDLDGDYHFGAFDYNSSLESIVVDVNNKVYDSRENCNAIIETATNTLIVGSNHTDIPESVTSIGDNAYSGRSMQTFDIPNNITSIGEGAFDSCTLLKSVTIPNSITAINDYTFYGCDSLISVTIPDSVTYIGDDVFSAIENQVTGEIEYQVTVYTYSTATEVIDYCEEYGISYVLLDSSEPTLLNEITQSGNSGQSIVTLDYDTANLKVTVPTVLPVNVDSDNNVTVADNAQISNLSNGQVDVTNAEIQTDEWSVVGFDTDFTKVPVDTKQYGFTLNGDDVSDGVNTSVFNTINGNDHIGLSYDANVAIQSQPITNEDIGRIVFTVAWHK